MFSKQTTKIYIIYNIYIYISSFESQSWGNWYNITALQRPGLPGQSQLRQHLSGTFPRGGQRLREVRLIWPDYSKTWLTWLLYCRVEVWLTCSNSPQCAPTCSSPPGCSAERLACADTCLETRLAARRQQEQEQLVSGSNTRQQLAILASRAGQQNHQSSSLTALLIAATSLVLSFSQAGLL